MNFNPDNIIFFYLTAALLAIAIAIIYHADKVGKNKENENKKKKI